MSEKFFATAFSNSGGPTSRLRKYTQRHFSDHVVRKRKQLVRERIFDRIKKILNSRKDLISIDCRYRQTINSPEKAQPFDFTTKRSPSVARNTFRSTPSGPTISSRPRHETHRQFIQRKSFRLDFDRSYGFLSCFASHCFLITNRGQRVSNN